MVAQAFVYTFKHKLGYVNFVRNDELIFVSLVHYLAYGGCALLDLIHNIWYSYIVT